jgi:hypothetical protein
MAIASLAKPTLTLSINATKYMANINGTSLRQVLRMAALSAGAA